MKPITALVVDDDENDRYLAKRILKKTGTIENIAEVADGEDLVRLLGDAKAYAELCGTVPPPTLILLDINMPRMNGLETLAALESYREAGVFDAESNSVIMMLTSSDHWNDRKQSLAYDFVKDYIDKPLTKDKLQSILQAHYC